MALLAGIGSALLGIGKQLLPTIAGGLINKFLGGNLMESNGGSSQHNESSSQGGGYSTTDATVNYTDDEAKGMDAAKPDLEYILQNAYTGGKPLPVNKYHDYFTSALPSPQKAGSSVKIPITGSAPIGLYNAVTGNVTVNSKEMKEIFIESGLIQTNNTWGSGRR